MQSLLTGTFGLSMVLAVTLSFQPAGRSQVTGVIESREDRLLRIRYHELTIPDGEIVEVYLTDKTELKNMFFREELRNGELVSVEYFDDGYRFIASSLERHALRRRYSWQHLMTYFQS